MTNLVPYYSDNLVSLYLGDCIDVVAWLQADVLVTDPPYGMAYKPGGLHSDRATRVGAESTIVSDESTAIRDRALDMWGTKPAIVFGTWRHPLRSLPTHRLIWHKSGRHPGVSPHPWFPNDEEIYPLGNGWVGKPSPTVLTTTEQRALEPGRIGHPTPKPLGLMERLIEKSPPGVIADPFAGSGSTLIAARNLGRAAIGVEIDESYCELIANRLSQTVLDFGDTA